MPSFRSRSDGAGFCRNSHALAILGSSFGGGTLGHLWGNCHGAAAECDVEYANTRLGDCQTPVVSRFCIGTRRLGREPLRGACAHFCYQPSGLGMGRPLLLVVLVLFFFSCQDPPGGYSQYPGLCVSSLFVSTLQKRVWAYEFRFSSRLRETSTRTGIVICSAWDRFVNGVISAYTAALVVFLTRLLM